MEKFAENLNLGKRVLSPGIILPAFNTFEKVKYHVQQAYRMSIGMKPQNHQYDEIPACKTIRRTLT